MKSSNELWIKQLEGTIPADWAGEIDTFETEMELRQKGKVDEKIFAETRLRRGVYGQHFFVSVAFFLTKESAYFSIQLIY